MTEHQVMFVEVQSAVNVFYPVSRSYVEKLSRKLICAFFPQFYGMTEFMDLYLKLVAYTYGLSQTIPTYFYGCKGVGIQIVYLIQQI